MCECEVVYSIKNCLSVRFLSYDLHCVRYGVYCRFEMKSKGEGEVEEICFFALAQLGQNAMSSRVFVKLLVNCHHKHIYIFSSALCLDLLPYILEGRVPVSRSDDNVWGKLSPHREVPVYREVRLPDF